MVSFFKAGNDIVDCRVTPDVPAMDIRWCYAIDEPKYDSHGKPSDKAPAKWSAFTSKDSDAIEMAYQSSKEYPDEDIQSVPVDEDLLFEVDVITKELRPIYFQGSSYEVRRAGWFIQDESTIKPCDEELAAKLEDGYVNVRPFEWQRAADIECASKSVWPLSGAGYIGKFVVYTNSSTAWLLSNDLCAIFTSNLYQLLTGGASLGGVKLIRGFSGCGVKEAPRDSDDMDIERPIDHLILCIHGIGQNLGGVFNFVSGKSQLILAYRDTNEFRRNLKETLASSPQFKRLMGNRTNPKSAIQVLPVQWRQNIHFEMDTAVINDAFVHDESEIENPTLQDITGESLTSLRGIISKGLLDILLYYTPQFRDRIARVVAREMNRIYNLFCQRNPTFRGSVSLVAHSLGSAICFDILCRQPSVLGPMYQPEYHDRGFALTFQVHSFFCIGSPLGLIQILRGRKIASRQLLQNKNVINSPLGPQFMGPTEKGAPFSCPKRYMTREDPADKKPLISKEMATVKPFRLPYTKDGLLERVLGVSKMGQIISYRTIEWLTDIRRKVSSLIISRALRCDERSIGNLIQEGNPNKSDPAIEIYQATTESRISNVCEAKLKALNSTGRVDFVIQEGGFELSYLSAFIAHRKYWKNKDVAHFILSQLLLGQ